MLDIYKVDFWYRGFFIEKKMVLSFGFFIRRFIFWFFFYFFVVGLLISLYIEFFILMGEKINCSRGFKEN